MKDEVIELMGAQPGPTSIILVGVHGNEVCGVEAVEAMLPRLRIEKGCVFVAYGNPRAIEQNVRFTEANLNRMFKSDKLLSDAERESYEYQRAQFLKQYLDQVDALLDVHASFTPGSRRFIICEQNAKAITRLLPLDVTVSGFDHVQPGGTDCYMNTNGKIGVCVECGFLGDASSTKIAEESIRAFLQARGHVSGEERECEDQSNIHIYMLYRTKTDSFVLTKPFADFEKVSAGQVIGTDGEKEVIAPKDGVILFALDVHMAGGEAFLLGE